MNTNLLKSKHCQLCEHKHLDFMTGTKCGLTSDKPSFRDKCKNIQFGKNLEEEISNLHIEIKKNQLKKNLVILNFFVFFILSIVTIFYSYYLFKVGMNYGVLIFRLPILVFVVGTVLLGYSINPLKNYLIANSILSQKKKELDSLLELYKIDFTIKIDYEKDIHGNKTFSHDLRVF